jgi:acyl carrier protein
VTSEQELRQQLRSWILARAKLQVRDLRDATPILEEGILSSLDIVEFVLFIESLRGAEVEIDDIDPAVFTSVDTVYSAFFAR